MTKPLKLPLENYNKKQTKLFIKAMDKCFADINKTFEEVIPNNETKEEAETRAAEQLKRRQDLVAAFKLQAVEFFENGADPNAKGKEEISFLYLVGRFFSDNVEKFNDLNNLIYIYQLDVNMKIQGSPLVTEFYRRDLYGACEVLINNGFNLDTPLIQESKKGKSRGTRFANVFRSQKSEVPSKKERPYNFQEALYPTTKSQINWHLPKNDINVVELAYIRKKITRMKKDNEPIEAYLKAFNINGWREFYFHKLKEPVRTTRNKITPDNLKLDKIFDKYKLSQVILQNQEELEKLLASPPPEMSEDDISVLNNFLKFLKINDISKEISDLLGEKNSYNDDFDKLENAVEKILAKLEQEAGIKLSLDDLHKEPLPEELKDYEKIAEFYKSDDESKELIAKQRAVLNDAAQMVMYSHKLGIEGKMDLENEEYKIKDLELEGSSIVHTLPEVTKTVQSFKESEAYKDFNENRKDDEKKAHDDTLELILETFKRGELAHENKDNEDNWKETARAYKQGKPVIFESRWEGHSAMTVLYKDHIYICNRGAGTSDASIKCYKIGDTSALLSENAHKKFKELSGTVRKDKRRLGELSGLLPGTAKFSNQAMMDELKLTRVKVHHIKGQKVGNCSYTNTKRGIDAIMLALKDRQELGEDYASGTPKEWKETHYDVSKVDQKGLYQSIVLFDRIQAIEQYFARLDKPGMDLNGTHQSYLIPLLLTLRDKNTSKRNVEIGKIILKGLRERGFSDDEIYKRIEALPQSQGKMSMLASRFFESRNKAFNENVRANSRQHFWRLLLPGGMRYHSNEFLRKIGMDSKVLKKSRWEQLKALVSKEKATIVLPPPQLERSSTSVQTTWVSSVKSQEPQRNLNSTHRSPPALDEKLTSDDRAKSTVSEKRPAPLTLSRHRQIDPNSATPEIAKEKHPDQCRSNTLAIENNPATSPSNSEDKKAKRPEEMSFTQKKEYFENLSKNPDSTGTSQNGLKKK